MENNIVNVRDWGTRVGEEEESWWGGERIKEGCEFGYKRATGATLVLMELFYTCPVQILLVILYYCSVSSYHGKNWVKGTWAMSASFFTTECELEFSKI